MAKLKAMHRALLGLAILVVITELSLIIVHYEAALNWLSHNLWVVLIPFAKVIIKKLMTMQLLVFLKLLLGLIWHLLKLLLFKLLKTLGLRYGVYFSQARWRWIRYIKVMFLRKGKLFFRSLKQFWYDYQKWQQWLIFVAFFPIVLLLFLAGLSFNVTRKTMVQRAKESAMFEAATSATTRTSGIKARVQQWDAWALEKIKIMNAAQANKTKHSPINDSKAKT